MKMWQSATRKRQAPLEECTIQWLRQLSSRVRQSQSARRELAAKALRRERPQRISTMRLEALEPRRLLSGTPSFIVTAGVLDAQLTDGDDSAIIQQLGARAGDGSATVRITIAGNPTVRTFSNITGVHQRGQQRHTVHLGRPAGPE